MLIFINQFFFKEIHLIQWSLINIINLSFILVLDWITYLFLFTVTLISLRVLIFRKSYINVDKRNKKFYFMLIIFILRIILLIISPNNLRILLGWDGLGVSSYLLVIYYNSNKANTSGIITLLINRGGDALILSALAIQCQAYRWITQTIIIVDHNKISIILFTLGLITKRAQLPFSSWLPAAIAAPTPVSSLVHSSTLVTAGVYIIIRINNIYIKINTRQIILIFGSLTTLIASLLAMKENDMKKIVALSTLSQLGFIVSILGLNCWLLAFTHLVNHAFFKALLFVATGNIIHSSNDSQDLKITGSRRLSMFNSIIIVLTASIAITGLTFLSAFYAKEVIVEQILLSKSRFYMSIIFLLNIFLTPIYTARRINIFYFTILKKTAKIYSENQRHIIKVSIALLLTPTFLSGFCINKIFYFKQETTLNTNNYLFLIIRMTLIATITIVTLTLTTVVKNTFKKIFYYSIWGITQFYFTTLPAYFIIFPSKMTIMERNMMVYFFNSIFHEVKTGKQPRKIPLHLLLIITLTSIIFLILYYLDNIKLKR